MSRISSLFKPCNLQCSAALITTLAVMLCAPRGQPSAGCLLPLLPPPPREEGRDVLLGMGQAHVPWRALAQWEDAGQGPVLGSAGLLALPEPWHLCCHVARAPLPAGRVSANPKPLGPAGVGPRGGGVVALPNQLLLGQFWVWMERWCEPCRCPCPCLPEGWYSLVPPPDGTPSHFPHPLPPPKAAQPWQRGPPMACGWFAAVLSPSG